MINSKCCFQKIPLFLVASHLSANILFGLASLYLLIVAVDSDPKIGSSHINGNSRILKWRYCTIFLAIFWGYIPLHRPYIGLKNLVNLRFFIAWWITSSCSLKRCNSAPTTSSIRGVILLRMDWWPSYLNPFKSEKMDVYIYIYIFMN